MSEVVRCGEEAPRKPSAIIPFIYLSMFTMFRTCMLGPLQSCLYDDYGPTGSPEELIASSQVTAHPDAGTGWSQIVDAKSDRLVKSKYRKSYHSYVIPICKLRRKGLDPHYWQQCPVLPQSSFLSVDKNF